MTATTQGSSSAERGLLGGRGAVAPGAAYAALQRLEGVQVLPLHKVDRSDLARWQLAGLHMPPRRDVRHPQFLSSFGQHHVCVISHAIRIRPDVESITRNGLYKPNKDRIKYVRRITKGEAPWP